MLSEVRRKRYYRHSQALNRNFKAVSQNSKWVTDISYIPTEQGCLYLSVIRDLYDKSIVAYQTSAQQTVTLVLDTVRCAMEKEVVAAELAPQRPRVSIHVTCILQPNGITPSMSRRGNPYDNALAENFFSILKTECLNRLKIRNFAQAQSLIDDFIHFYNFGKFQLKYRLTPMQKRSQTA